MSTWLDAIAAEGRAANDTPGTITDAKVCIDGALAFLAEVPSDGLDLGADLPIAIELPGWHYVRHDK